ncbi:MAG: D-alanyl-D-alanine dipeptidase [uncultured bacterium]|nr:MAG: D-alanyl-D-alanine dipeptidase [uncultured bacterium]OFW69198.1 MAG: D-alanyl-D-alanine dipeptidase [Alphaproteobacteria bacterium GWC2_42_16]OFW73883.1 MAG: D-alanyl-D-alanine dipeptidase [Alphaproteobacteria bacterium GWA2_41_27]OFW82738.1 MAG: D-alanyl-D-alanine dipeptidase [Alphaproteobacteria bacterium RIFCSPHIGHO2_12_FULL_42_100]OFW86523.1 MAG: D-alanyl-D-alanine dipeptidase [Alphaproteobacteria bacterium RBG_16_42_14]OFW91892.1 MAG: D-alanyl-D-alanine dipeptidase [Alphaproteobac
MTQHTVAQTQKLPEGFVYLQDIDPSIVQDIRYAQYHNFVGCPLPGYNAAIAIICEAAAYALKAVQEVLKPFNLSLKVYDAYRPQDAVDFFSKWAEDHQDQSMKAEFYPTIDKRNVFSEGYIAKKSFHTRGGAVDLTIIPLPVPSQALWKPGDPVLDGRLPKGQRFDDNSLDMGTGFDCLDELSHTANPNVPAQARANRLLLKSVMEKHGFENYHKEWWHFNLLNEPFPDTYFNFPVQ